MTLQIEPRITTANTATPTNRVPRGGSYITLPGDQETSPRTEGSYVSLPGGLPNNGSKAQGTYVTLHGAPLGETEISYTRRG
jgi:hypothetical protein